MTYTVTYAAEDSDEMMELGQFDIEANDLTGLLTGIKITIGDQVDIGDIERLSIKCSVLNSEKASDDQG